MAEISKLRAQGRAIVGLESDRKDELRKDMEVTGDLRCESDFGAAYYSTSRRVRVRDLDALLRILTPAQLGKILKPDVAFMGACEELGLDTSEALEVVEVQSFRVDSSRSAEERGRLSKIMDRAREEAQERLVEYVQWIQEHAPEVAEEGPTLCATVKAKKATAKKKGKKATAKKAKVKVAKKKAKKVKPIAAKRGKK